MQRMKSSLRNGFTSGLLQLYSITTWSNMLTVLKEKVARNRNLQANAEIDIFHISIYCIIAGPNKRKHSSSSHRPSESTAVISQNPSANNRSLERYYFQAI